MENEIAKLSYGYYLKDMPKTLTLSFPVVNDIHPIFGPNMIQMHLDNGYIMDGEIEHDFRNNRYLVRLKKL